MFSATLSPCTCWPCVKMWNQYFAILINFNKLDIAIIIPFEQCSDTQLFPCLSLSPSPSLLLSLPLIHISSITVLPSRFLNCHFILLTSARHSDLCRDIIVMSIIFFKTQRKYSHTYRNEQKSKDFRILISVQLYILINVRNLFCTFVYLIRFIIVFFLNMLNII